MRAERSSTTCDLTTNVNAQAEKDWLFFNIIHYNQVLVAVSPSLNSQRVLRISLYLRLVEDTRALVRSFHARKGAGTGPGPGAYSAWMEAILAARDEVCSLFGVKVPEYALKPGFFNDKQDNPVDYTDMYEEAFKGAGGKALDNYGALVNEMGF